jgi:uncharacterized protein YerC
MSGHARERLKSDALRARIRQMIEAGYSDARIVRETGHSLAHVQRVASQERAELERCGTPS